MYLYIGIAKKLPICTSMTCEICNTIDINMYVYIYIHNIHPDCKQNNEAAHVGILSSQLGRDQHLLHAGHGSLVIQTMLLLLELLEFAKDNSTSWSTFDKNCSMQSVQSKTSCHLFPFAMAAIVALYTTTLGSCCS